ncbi:MAG: hypothetical protein V7629_11890 [Motiliproteus sp.]
MRTRQRAEEVCKKLGLAVGSQEFQEIQKALEQQELDTRRACAVAVGKVVGETGDDLIDAGQAQAACLDT